MEKKGKTDLKFIVGLVLLILVIGLMTGFFWQTVARQAEEERMEEQRRQEQEAEEAITAIAVEYGDVLKARVFVDLETEKIFRTEVPEEGIYNRNGVLIEGDVLEYGDMVRIYGGSWKDEETDMLPVLDNPGRMERVSRADLHFAQTYQDLVDETQKQVKNGTEGQDTGDIE